MSVHSASITRPATLASTRDERDSKTSLVLNFFPATLSDTTARVWSGRWSDPEEAAALRESVPGLVTWRDREDGNRMYLWRPHEPLERAPEGFQEVTVALDESPQLFERLIRDAVRERFIELGFTEKGGGFVNYRRPSLLAKVPALAGAAGEAIGIYPKIVTDVFFTRNASDHLVIGLVVDVLYTTRLDVTAAEWVAAGIAEELRGKYVVLVRESAEGRRFPQFVGRVIGRIDGIRGSRCVLTDLRDPALAEVELNDVAPEPTRQNLGCYLSARYEKAFRAGEQQLTQKLRQLLRPAERHRLACALVQERLTAPTAPGCPAGLEILTGLRLTFREMAAVGPESFPLRRLIEPTFSFDRAGNDFHRRVDLGLRQYGPYDREQMRREAFRILVVAPEENKGEVTAAIQRLLGGVWTPENVFGGLRQMYRLQDLQVTHAFAAGSSMKHYADTVNRAIQEAPPANPGSSRFHLILTVIHQAHRLLPDSENPYFQAKALALITEGIPTQAVAIEKLRSPDGSLQYILNTMSLACYAKLGGTSHVLKLPLNDPGSPTELVFGVGRSMRRAGRFGDAVETIGFTTVFRANGEYLYNDCTPYCEGVSYERALEETIRRTVERVAAFEQLPDLAPLRLVFHVPRRPGRREERPILNAIGKLTKYTIEFALVHVNEDHHLQLFDLANTNARDSKGRGKPEASLLPARGLAVAIGPRERLVTFVGVDQYRGNGCPTPLRITLDKRSTFKDVEYVTQQLFLLSFMSARTLNPGIAPVTIGYAEQLAQLTGHLRGVQQWTVELIQRRLGRKLWFI